MKSWNFYDRPGFDKAGHLRTDKVWLERQIASDSSQIVPIWRSRNFVADIENPRLTTVPMNKSIVDDSPVIVFLGLFNDAAHFAVDLSHYEKPPFCGEGLSLIHI